jgi:hypothetical protein
LATVSITANTTFENDDLARVVLLNIGVDPIRNNRFQDARQHVSAPQYETLLLLIVYRLSLGSSSFDETYITP